MFGRGAKFAAAIDSQQGVVLKLRVRAWGKQLLIIKSKIVPKIHSKPGP
jgi:hypothetical protein